MVEPHRSSPSSRNAPEASFERLVALAGYLAAWRLLLKVFQRVLQTIERGYRILFASCPPHFNGVLSTVVIPEQAQVLEQEIEHVPLPERDSGFYSRYFIVQNKCDGFHPIYIRVLNHTLRMYRFRMLML